MDRCVIDTPLGSAEILGDKFGIQKITIIEEDESPSTQIPESLNNCVDQLANYFSGSQRSFNLKLNPQGTDFQKKVWKKLVEVSFGKTISYQKLAKDLGDIKAIRAVASANGKNPIWIVIPCHRVIGSDGSLVGYAGGLGRKEWLLRHEGAIQQTLFS
ncbi:methylated-DNA--[protein]-cysteine S-methyltransferase [Aegicerativicinus sediminis]|uniref:methylated-DNA--[protein]-cysteine S-methyltransferase n=1 Tax=Aegicerativicinus sediminis TaxID=2893202 RepID=UPI001E481D14|nr:methylated-DNA--[protein]-cysteine S-methyltransferase [Aegicerativicinus sediminis]